jgi:hypothetical protein
MSKQINFIYNTVLNLILMLGESDELVKVSS